MLDNDEVLVGCPVRVDLDLLLVGTVVFNVYRVGFKLVRTKDVDLQLVRLTFCGTADVEVIALCNDGSGRNCGQERLFQRDRNSCILGLGERILISRSAGCIDGVCTSVKTSLGSVPFLFPRVVRLYRKL